MKCTPHIRWVICLLSFPQWDYFPVYEYNQWLPVISRRTKAPPQRIFLFKIPHRSCKAAHAIIALLRLDVEDQTAYYAWKWNHNKTLSSLDDRLRVLLDECDCEEWHEFSPLARYASKHSTSHCGHEVFCGWEIASDGKATQNALDFNYLSRLMRAKVCAHTLTPVIRVVCVCLVLMETE